MPATMHRLTKKIVSPGKHNAVKNGSTREVSEITPERIDHWVESFNAMKGELGYEIPNPALHYDKNGNPPLPVTISEKGELLDPRTGEEVKWDANLNLGFWDKLFKDEDGDLAGEVVAPGDPSDPNTPAGKLGTTIKQTSVGSVKEYTDGKGKVWKDVLGHIASCIHPVEANQKNFIPSEKGEFTLMSMSTLMGDGGYSPENVSEKGTTGEDELGDSPKDIKEVLRLLKENGIDLPEDTTQDNLVERLGLVLQQKLTDEKNQDEELMPKPPKPADPNKQPPNSIEKTGMSTMSTQIADPPKVDSLDITMSIFASDKKKDFKKRIKSIVDLGALTEDEAKELFGDVEMFTMSQADFDPATKTIKRSNLEFGLDCIESVLEKVKAKIEKGDKELVTMSTIFTNDYNAEKDKEHNTNLRKNDSDEIGDDEDFLTVMDE